MKRFVLYVAYFVIMNYFIKLPVQYYNNWEILIGSIIMTFFMNIIDIIFYKISYSLTGHYGRLIDVTSNEMRCAHWLIRLILSLLLLASTNIPAVSSILTMLVHQSYIYISFEYREIINSLASKLTEPYIPR